MSLTPGYSETPTSPDEAEALLPTAGNLLREPII